MSEYTVFPVVVTPTYCNIKDDILAYIWMRLEQEDKIKDLFYDDSITNLNLWLGFIKAPFNYPVIVYNSEIRGIAWLNNLDNKNARCHFAFLGSFKRGAAKAIMEYWDGLKSPVDETPMFKTFYGITPEYNEKALHVAKLMGFETLGTLPNFCKVHNELVGGVITYHCPKEE